MTKPQRQESESHNEEGVRIPLNLMKSLRRDKESMGSGSSSGENNSEDSALVSIGNAFGLNFDSGEEGSNNAVQNSEDDGQGILVSSEKTPQKSVPARDHNNQLSKQPPETKHTSLKPRPTGSTGLGEPASLQAMAASSYPTSETSQRNLQQNRDAQSSELKRKAPTGSDNEDDSDGYDSDEEQGGPRTSTERSLSNGSTNTTGSPKHKKKKGDNKRKERNAREKERSFRIAKKINELRELLSTGGVIVPKGTKSSVLTEAASYIRTLQQHQYRAEVDRQQLIQQMQMIGGGAHGPQAATAIRQLAAQNGVWSLGNFGGAPPSTKPSPSAFPSEQKSSETTVPGGFLQANQLEPLDYRFFFNSCGIGMAVASMGGAFIDCNQLFSQLTEYTKQDLSSLTIFNLTARQDLQKAFDQISQLISPPMKPSNEAPLANVIVRGSFKNRPDLGLSISIVKGEDGIAKCFCVTLIKNPSSSHESNPVPVSFESVEAPILHPPQKDSAPGLNGAPAFTSG